MDDETTTTRKQALRRQLRAARTARSHGEDGAALRAREAERLLEHAAPLLAEVEQAAAEAGRRGDPAPLVAAFHPTPTEADVLPLARRLVEAGARLAFPAAAGDELEWIVWDGSTPFQDSPGRGFGKEPAGERLGPRALQSAVLVLAPAVAVDRSCTRIGHGAGYYDRALDGLGPGTRVVAVVHPEELLPAGTLPRGVHDVPIPEVLTADGLVSLVTSARA
ncbi:5-formyltetrahydrofolate cyclo-ligase [Brachybacterium saurashtrense]|uniref:5-formyltetrahydrofolate cyclo-ligase n=1 Tax=Brachybacterium saurashtrense TaxID=556288 RepID=A0A345YLN5_9MICO|nr:5-formyltetrahydrofolate cyclo-ligase [Brachybacterium saurashtrense]AXK44837.1 5-formyltetrahydrofolate cyclo-ligase [Brachybacterium saurashtrense]RRR20813.1 5-formyltetrahydrofolate cyclo-ligase [Brachybacterium saurashtrense]